MVKRKDDPPETDETKTCGRKHWLLVIIPAGFFLYASLFILYYLYVVTSSGETPKSSIFTDLTDLVASVFKLFIDANR